MKKKITKIAQTRNADYQVRISDEGVESIELMPSGFYPFEGMVYDFDIYLVTKTNGDVIVFPAREYMAYWEDDE